MKLAPAFALLAAAAFAAPPTFNHDIAPILYQNCAGCHRPGQVAPFPLLTYHVELIGITPHAHLLCKEMKVDAHFPDGKTADVPGVRRAMLRDGSDLNSLGAGQAGRLRRAITAFDRTATANSIPMNFGR